MHVKSDPIKKAAGADQGFKLPCVNPRSGKWRPQSQQRPAYSVCWKRQSSQYTHGKRESVQPSLVPSTAFCNRVWCTRVGQDILIIWHKIRADQIRVPSHLKVSIYPLHLSGPWDMQRTHGMMMASQGYCPILYRDMITISGASHGMPDLSVWRQKGVSSS